MKRAILILFVFLAQFDLPLVAQSMEINDQSRQFVEFNNVLSLGDGKWLLGGVEDPGGDNNLYFKIVDSLFEITSNNNTSQERIIEKMVVKGNVGFVLNTINNQEYISKFSFSSNSLLFHSSALISSDEIINNIRILPNGNLVAVGYKIIDNQLRSFFKIFQGNMIVDFSDYSEPGYYSDVVSLADSTFVLTGGFGATQIFGGRKYNMYYEQIGDIMEGIESDQIFPLNNGYLLLKDQTLTKLDSDFQIETSVNFVNYGFIRDVVVDDEKAFLLYQNPGESPMILRLNSFLELEDLFSVEDEKFQAKSIDVSESEIGICGYLIPAVPFNNTPHMHPSTSGFFKTFSKNEMSNEEEMDLEIFEVTVEDHEKDFACGEPGTTSSYHLNLKNIKVGLVNKGSKTINDVDLFLEVLGLKLCVTGTPTPQYYFQKEEFSILRLEPGDTLRWRTSPFEFPQRIEDTSTINICVWHTTVEGRRDFNPINDYFCGEVVLKTGYVEEPIKEPTEGEYLFYPNPINEKLTVSLLRAPYEPTLIKFYDYLGRESDVKYSIAARAKYKEFDISQLPSGFYFVRISNEFFEDMIRVYVN
jgi:hypothetical protein